MSINNGGLRPAFRISEALGGEEILDGYGMYAIANPYKSGKQWSATYIENYEYNYLMMSATSDDDATERLRKWFWGDYTPSDLPSGTTKPEHCQHHEWHEVILFHTPQLRCRFCDIKKSSAEGGTK